MVARSIGLLAAAGSLASAALEDDLYSFVSRPDIKVPRLVVDRYEAGSANPGLLFMTPNSDAHIGDGKQYGPVIYDNQGELVWAGQSEASGNNIRNAFVCSFQGQDHICYSEIVRADQPVVHKILDGSYNEVLSVHPVNDGSLPAELGNDEHEFNVIAGFNSSLDNPSDHALVNAFITQPYDAIVCGKQIHFVNSYVFQDILLDGSNKAIFTWNALDHIRPEEAVVCPGQDSIVNTGADASSPFDFFHLNSIDKDTNGDYLISSRHTSTLFKIAGINSAEPGKVLWRLGGRQSHFTMSSAVNGETHDFAYQHHARFANQLPGADAAKGIIGITLWDNSNSDRTLADQIRPYSSGKSFLIDTIKMTAVMSEVFASPSRSLDANQGSHQLLANGNHLLGEGNVAKISEFNLKRGLSFSAHLSKRGVNSYRSLKFPWKGQPKSKPDLFAYSQSCEASKTYLYASWNGATEVHHYTFFTSMTRNGQFSAGPTVMKTSFETSASSSYARWVYVAAYDKDNKELGRSEPVSVWVPKGEDVKNGECTEARCNAGFSYKHHGRRDCSNMHMQLKKRGDDVDDGNNTTTTATTTATNTTTTTATNTTTTTNTDTTTATNTTTTTNNTTTTNTDTTTTNSTTTTTTGKTTKTSSSYSFSSPSSSRSAVSRSRTSSSKPPTQSQSATKRSRTSSSSSFSQSQSATKRSRTTSSSPTQSQSATRRSRTSTCTTTHGNPYPTYDPGYPYGYPTGYSIYETCHTSVYETTCDEGITQYTTTWTEYITVPCAKCTEMPYPEPYPEPYPNSSPTGGAPEPAPQPAPGYPAPDSGYPAPDSGYPAPDSGSGSGYGPAPESGDESPPAPAPDSESAPSPAECEGEDCPVPIASKTHAMALATGAAASIIAPYALAGMAAAIGLAVL